MVKKNFAKSVRFIEVEDLQENRFSFIENVVLRENVAIKMQYVVFLVSLEEEYILPGASTYSLFKTIIVFTASIVEAVIHYKLKQMIDQGLVNEKDIMPTDTKLSLQKKYLKLEDGREICGIIKATKPMKLNDTQSFTNLNKAAKKSGLFTKVLFDYAEEIRKSRNRIHTFSLKSVDDTYTKKEIDEIFKKTSIIIERIETFRNK
jgi:hypothetical protein